MITTAKTIANYNSYMGGVDMAAGIACRKPCVICDIFRHRIPTVEFLMKEEHSTYIVENSKKVYLTKKIMSDTFKL